MTAFYIGNSVFKILRRPDFISFIAILTGVIVANNSVSAQVKFCTLTIAYALPEKIIEQKVDFLQ